MSRIIHISHFCLRAGNFKLHDIELEVPENEIFAILGKTGSGKTLLLESVAGFYKGDSGAVYIQGLNVRDLAPENRQLGFVYQDFGLFPHLTVYENIRYGLKMRKFDGEGSAKSVRDMAQLLDIEHLFNQYPGTLSGGECQRTALARALVLNPKVLLMDEPFSALDPKTREQMYALVEKIHRNFQCTILFVTHDFSEAQRMAGRVGIMVKGELRATCRAADLFQRYADQEIEDFLGAGV